MVEEVTEKHTSKMTKRLDEMLVNAIQRVTRLPTSLEPIVCKVQYL